MDDTTAHVEQLTTLKGAVGLIRTAHRRMVSVEPFFMDFIDGVEHVLRPYGLSTLLAVTQTIDEEIETYRRWATSDIVGGVLVMNVLEDDPRLEVLQELGIPAVMVGYAHPDYDFPAVYANDAVGMRAVIEHLSQLGHTRIAQVTGPENLLHTHVRVRELSQFSDSLGLDVVTAYGDYSEAAGESLTNELFDSANPPTAVVFHNDVMAVAGLRAIQARGLAVPLDVAVVAWDDSAVCRLTQPPLTTAAVDVFGMGRAAALALVDESRGVAQEAPVVLDPVLLVRGSTV